MKNDELELQKQKLFLKWNFSILSDHVNDIIKSHNVMPAEITVPCERNGRKSELTLIIHPVEDVK